VRSFILFKAERIPLCASMVLALLLCSYTISVCAAADTPTKSNPADIVRCAAADGRIAYKLTTPDELKALLGPDGNETVRNDGGMEILDLKYSNVQATFGRMRRYSTPSTLLWIHVNGKPLDIGQERRIVKYEAIDVQGIPVKMHEPPVSSIAVGKTCGVAPGASLYYFAVPMWKPENKPYYDIIDKLNKLNADPTTTQRVRVVSISTGMFSQQTNFERWKEALKKADQNGILIVKCAQDSIHYGMLARIPGKDPDDPAGYKSGIYGVRPGAVLVPASNRTTACHTGNDVYTYWREAGMSWAAPYLAGLAVLAYQVNPEIESEKIVTLWQKTALQTNVGAVVQPRDFIEAVRKTQ